MRERADAVQEGLSETGYAIQDTAGSRHLLSPGRRAVTKKITGIIPGRRP